MQYEHGIATMSQFVLMLNVWELWTHSLMKIRRNFQHTHVHARTSVINV